MNLLDKFKRKWFKAITRPKYENCHNSAVIEYSSKIFSVSNLVMAQNTNIDAGATIMNTRARFIMKRNSGAAVGLTVVTGNHLSIPGRWFKNISDKDKDLLSENEVMDKDVVVEEDVWIATNVTLLSGSIIGRGSEIGSGSVVRGSVPPYAIVIGNPAKVVGFKFTPEEIIEHEKALYPEEERLPLELLEKNYNKYFISRIKEIKEFTRLSL